jgi:hypothetical protein
MAVAQPRLISRKPRVFYRPAASGGAGAWTEISGFFNSFELMPKRGRIDSRGFGTVGARNDKGDPEHQVKLGVYHSRDWSELSALLVTELNADDATEFMWKARGSVATSADNPYRQVSVMLTSLGNLGGAQNTISRLEETFDIEGQILKSTTAGDPPADGTFSVEM